jgi:hypothetical protein
MPKMAYPFPKICTYFQKLIFNAVFDYLEVESRKTNAIFEIYVKDGDAPQLVF